MVTSRGHKLKYNPPWNLIKETAANIEVPRRVKVNTKEVSPAELFINKKDTAKMSAR